jgi:uncharacterized repeat protein (TIGR03803 family)
MNTLFNRHVLSAAAAALLAGCGQGQGDMARTAMIPPSVKEQASQHGYQLIYSFKGAGDGEYPLGGLVRIGRSFYGLTNGSGCISDCVPGSAGTVFEWTRSGSERVLYSFKGVPDAESPTDELLDVNGVLYGTTQQGGAFGHGAVFSVTTAGAEKVVYSFKGGSDGETPFAGLVEMNGSLYGTAFNGGSGCGSGCGTVFVMSTSGSERVLYSFKGYPHDGAHPIGSLVALNGVLYGATWAGGGACKSGCGTIFSISTSGQERVLHSFKGGPDGANPAGALTNLGDTLYGTTVIGGKGTACSNFGCGTVFDISTSGKKLTLYSFKGGRDALEPNGGLLPLDGLLYGTAGGGSKCAPSGRCGTVFSVSTSGAERVLYRFKGFPDASFPGWPLLAVKGSLFGTAVEGGANKYGALFALTP